MVKNLSEFPNVTGTSWGKDAMPSNPKIASLASQVIAATSIIENMRAHILANILGADLQVSMAMYSTISNTQQRQKALLAAAKVGLPEDEARVLRRIEQVTAGTSQARHKFAHWIWGQAKEMPDALLLIPQVYDNDQVMAFPGGTGFILPAPHDKILVYTESDLEKIVEDAWTAASYFRRFHGHLLSKSIQDFGERNVTYEPEEAANTMLEIATKLRAAREESWAILKAL